VPSSIAELNSKRWLRSQYATKGRHLADIAAELGCSVRTVSAAVARFDLQRGHVCRPRHPALNSKQQLARIYAETGSYVRVAEALHCATTTLVTALDRHGIDHRQHGVIRYDNRTWFEHALERGLTVTAMANELGAQRESIYKALNRFGLPRPQPYRGGSPQAR
jgi:hypothetical protein